MKQIILGNPVQPATAEAPCLGHLVTLGVMYGIAMLFLWQLVGPTPFGHALVWILAGFAGLKLWRAAEGA